MHFEELATEEHFGEPATEEESVTPESSSPEEKTEEEAIDIAPRMGGFAGGMRGTSKAF